VIISKDYSKINELTGNINKKTESKQYEFEGWGVIDEGRGSDSRHSVSRTDARSYYSGKSDAKVILKSLNLD